MFEMINTAFKNVYDLTEHIAIDEIIVKFKGRVIFRQYIPKKRKQLGIKLYIKYPTKTVILIICRST